MPSMWDEPGIEARIRLAWVGCIALAIGLLGSSLVFFSPPNELSGLLYIGFAVCATCLPILVAKLIILKRYGDAGLRRFWARRIAGRPLHLWWGPFISLSLAVIYAQGVRGVLAWPIVSLMVLVAAVGAWRLVRWPAGKA